MKTYEQDFEEWDRNRTKHPWDDSREGDELRRIEKRVWLAAAEKYSKKWVSVKERLPKKGVEVICLNWDDEIFASIAQERCTRRPTDYMIAEPTLSLPDGVTHWLDNTPPLPKEDE